MVDCVADLPSGLMNQDTRVVITVMYLATLGDSKCDDYVEGSADRKAVVVEVEKMYDQWDKRALKSIRWHCFVQAFGMFGRAFAYTLGLWLIFRLFVRRCERTPPKLPGIGVDADEGGIGKKSVPKIL